MTSVILVCDNVILVISYNQYLLFWTLLKFVSMQNNILLELSSCIPGTGPDPDCDPSLEAEVVKPEKCGKIQDKTGPFR